MLDFKIGDRIWILRNDDLIRDGVVIHLNTIDHPMILSLPDTSYYEVKPLDSLYVSLNKAKIALITRFENIINRYRERIDNIKSSFTS